MLRVWRLFPPRYSTGAHSNTATDAPDSRAVSAAHSAAFPPPATATSVSMICSPTLCNRISFPSLAKEGWLRPSTKCRAASLAGAAGVVGSSHRLSVVEQTTPAAPSKEGKHFLDGASSPPLPRRGVLLWSVPVPVSSGRVLQAFA